MAEPFAEIEYHGVAGSSMDCQRAVMRLLQFGDRITTARIISATNSHAFLLTNDVGDSIAVKAGFSSGYGGEGPRRLSFALQLLRAYGVEIDETEVDAEVAERLDKSALTAVDLDRIRSARPILPTRWHDYMYPSGNATDPGLLWAEFPLVVPLALIDVRLIDLARDFWAAPDANLMTAYRRLEDIVRKRTGASGSGSKLFSSAMNGADAKVRWAAVEDPGERTGRANLFAAVYMAHRGPRAHRELAPDPIGQLSELLLVNHLFRLEQESDVVVASKTEQD